MVDERPYEDVQFAGPGFSIPEMKWRELLFVGALRREGEHFMRDPARPLPAFRDGDLFPEGALFAIRREGGRVHITRLAP